MRYFLARVDDLPDDSIDAFFVALEQVGDQFNVNVEAGYVGDVMADQMAQSVGVVASDIGI